MTKTLYMSLYFILQCIVPVLMQSCLFALTIMSTRPLTCSQRFPDFLAHLEKLAEAIHPLLDAPPVNIPGVTNGSLRKRLAAAKTLMPIVKCGVLAHVCFDIFG